MMNYLPQQQYRPMVYRALPISSEMEMNNTTVDFSGAPTYFHNQTNNEIYVKQFDIKTGLTTTQKYIKADNAGHEIGGGKSDFDIKTYEDKLEVINDRLDGLEKMIAKKGAKNE